MSRVRDFLSVSVLALAALATGSPADRSAWSALLQEGIDRGFPGFVLLVDPGEGSPWIGAAGYASLEDRVELTPDHAFHLASVTKLFTAVAVLRLVDDGRLGLDDRLTDLLDAETVSGLPFAGEIRLAQLLDHSSGIYGTNNDPDYIAELVGPRAGAAAGWSALDFVRLAARREPFGRPGSGHFYGDTNYVLLGLIVESKTGRPLREHIRDTLFGPLGLKSAYYLSDLDPGSAPPVATVQGYLRLSEVVRPLLAVDRFRAVGEELLNTTSAGERIDGAGAIVANAGDLARFGAAVFRGDLLSPASHRYLLAAAEGLESEPVGTERQRTLHAYHRPDGVLITAEGDGPGGSHALLAYHPATDTIVVGLVNVFGLFDEMEFLLERVLPEVLPDPLPKPPS